MQIKRKNIRFEPDLNALVQITTANGEEVIGLALSESYKGCSAVFVLNDFLKIQTVVSLKLGNIDIARATVRWNKTLSDKVMEVGFEFEN